MILVIILRRFLIGLLFGQIEADVWQNAEMYLYIVALSIPFLKDVLDIALSLLK